MEGHCADQIRDDVQGTHSGGKAQAKHGDVQLSTEDHPAPHADADADCADRAVEQGGEAREAGHFGAGADGTGQVGDYRHGGCLLQFVLQGEGGHHNLE